MRLPAIKSIKHSTGENSTRHRKSPGFKLIVFLTMVTGLGTNPYTANAQDLLRQPESVVYDVVNQRYLVSNKQNGNIIQIDGEGNQSIFYTGLVSCRGLVITGNTLYVASDLGVVGLDLDTKSLIMTVNIPGMGFLNDITADTDGNLYVSDSGNSRIYRVKTSTQSYATLVSTGVNGCNGLLWDNGNNRLIICLWPYPGYIKAFNMTNSSLTTLKMTELNECDGLASDTDGNIYISSWGSGKIYRYDPDFANEKVLISQNHNGPADIFINTQDNILAVPNFNSNSIDFISLSEIHVSTQNLSLDHSGIWLRQNAPNPFHTYTQITYSIPRPGNITLKIFDASGREVETLVNERKPAGTYEVELNGSHLPSGVYTYLLQAGPCVNAKKMIVIK